MKRKIAILAAALMSFCLAAATAGAAEGSGWKKEDGKSFYYLENGEKATGWTNIDGLENYFDSDGVWHEELGTRNLETIKDAFYALYEINGSPERGFDIGTYYESDMGHWLANQLYWYFSGVDQNSDEVLAYYDVIGMDKHYYAPTDTNLEWSVFTPKDYDSSRKYPVVFGMFMGGTNIFFAEGMGIVENAALNDYIAVFITWGAMQGLTESQQAAYDESGEAHYDSFSFKSAYDQLIREYSIDTERVYLAGISGGGNACAMIAEDHPELVTGISPAMGASIQGDGAEQLEKVSALGLGMLMFYGDMDVEERWPIVKAPKEMGPFVIERTLEERVDNVNAWSAACGAVTEPSTVEDAFAFWEAEENSAAKQFGLKFDSLYTEKYETDYMFGVMLDKDGNPRVKYMCIDGAPHAVAPEWASEIYGFLSHFSRDAESRVLVYNE